MRTSPSAHKATLDSGAIGIEIDLSELTQIANDLEEAIQSPGIEIMELVGEDIVDGIQEEFETAGRGRWPPLAESTLARRRGSIAQILVDTGVMRGSIDQDAIRAGEASVQVGTEVEYAVYHVSDGPRSKIPKRDFYDIADLYLQRAEETLLDGILQKAGFK